MPLDIDSLQVEARSASAAYAAAVRDLTLPRDARVLLCTLGPLVHFSS